MMYPFVKYADETEVVFSDIRTKENGEEYICVCFERPTIKGFDTIIFELPSYEIVKKDGISSIMTNVDVGSLDEKGYPKGISHFIEHLLFN